MDDGGYSSLTYNVYSGTVSDDLALIATNVSSLYYQVLELLKGRRYYFQVSAVNPVSESTRSEKAELVFYTAPSVPVDLKLTPGPGYVGVRWSEPDDFGGYDAAQLKYRVYYGTRLDSLFLIANNLDDTGYQVNNLTNGIMVYIGISAINPFGEGDAAVSNATPIDLPSEPLDLKARTGDSFIHLTWKAPIKDGGSKILEYRVLKKSLSIWVDLATVNGNTLEYNDTQVINGNEYAYKVKAATAAGESGDSGLLTAKPWGLPGTPSNVSASIHGNSVIITWDEPVDNGGSFIKSYRVYRSVGSEGPELLTEVDDVSYTDDTVVTGSKYKYQIVAVSYYGEGEKSEPVIVDMKQGGDGPSSSSIMVVAVILILLVLLCIIAAVAFFVIRKRGQNKEASSEVLEPDIEKVPDQEPSEKETIETEPKQPVIRKPKRISQGDQAPPIAPEVPPQTIASPEGAGEMDTEAIPAEESAHSNPLDDIFFEEEKMSGSRIMTAPMPASPSNSIDQAEISPDMAQFMAGPGDKPAQNTVSSDEDNVWSPELTEKRTKEDASSAVEMLKKLNDLKKSGAISNEEYEISKRRLLRKI